MRKKKTAQDACQEGAVPTGNTEVFVAIEAAFQKAAAAPPEEYDAVLRMELQQIWEEHDLLVVQRLCSVGSGMGN